MAKKTSIPEAAIMAVMIMPFLVKKVNSKKLRVNGMKKAPSMMPIIVIRSVARRRFKGFEIQ